jgi:hypothetical protein
MKGLPRVELYRLEFDALAAYGPTRCRPAWPALTLTTAVIVKERDPGLRRESGPVP